MMAGKCVYRNRLFRPENNLGSNDRPSAGVVQSALDEFEDVGAGELDVEDVCRTRRWGDFNVRWGFGRCVLRQLARRLLPVEVGSVVEADEAEVEGETGAQWEWKSRSRTLLTPPVSRGPLPVTHRKAERRPARGYMSWNGR